MPLESARRRDAAEHTSCLWMRSRHNDTDSTASWVVGARISRYSCLSNPPVSDRFDGVRRLMVWRTLAAADGVRERRRKSIFEPDSVSRLDA